MTVYLLLTQVEGADQKVRAFATFEDRYLALLAWAREEFNNHHDLIAEAAAYGMGGLLNWLDDMERATGAELPFYIVEDCDITPELPFGQVVGMSDEDWKVRGQEEARADGLRAAESRGHEMILELQFDSEDIVEGYKDRSASDRDFVYIEEGLSKALVEDGIYTDDHYMAACRLVFDWLTKTHGVEPPAWFVAGKPEGV